MDSLHYFIVGAIFLSYVLFEIYRRVKRKPLSFVISEQENAISYESNEKKVKNKKLGFYERAHRVNFNVKRGYQQTVFMVFTVIGGVVGFILSQPIFIIAGIGIGLFYPYYKLNKMEEEYQNELPLRAEQAINAVEQQLHGDIPIFDALKNAVPYMQEPLRTEYGKAVESVEKTSLSMKKALEDIPHKLQLPQLEYFHMILEVAEQTEEKATEIIRDASDVLRRQQKHMNRYNQETIDSKKEMTFMFYLLVSMVVSFIFLLPDSMPFANSPLHRALDVFAIGGSAIITWIYRKKIQAKNLF